MSRRLQGQLQARDQGAVPAGEHLVTLHEVRVVNRRKGGFGLRLLSVTSGGATLREIRNLAREGDDPYALTAGQRRTFKVWCGRLGLNTTDPEQAVQELGRLLGRPVAATVRHTPHATLVRHSAAGRVHMRTAAGALTTDGELTP